MFLPKKAALTPEQYLAQEREAETRSEYLNGEIFSMTGASREHNQISSNIVVNLGVQLSEKACSVYSSDMKVKQAKPISMPILTWWSHVMRRSLKTIT